MAIRPIASVTLAALLSAGPVAVVRANGDEGAARSDAAPSIAQLVLRDYKIAIRFDPRGDRYIVADRAGNVLSAALSANQLADRYPELFDLLQPAIAQRDTNADLLMLAPSVD